MKNNKKKKQQKKPKQNEVQIYFVIFLHSKKIYLSQFSGKNLFDEKFSFFLLLLMLQ